MGWLKRAVKRAIKALARVVVRLGYTLTGLALGVFDLFFGFLCWPKKKLRIQVFVLSDHSGPVVTDAELQPAIDYTRDTLKQRFNVELLPYGSRMVEIIKKPTPDAALNPRGGADALVDEMGGDGEAGEFFAQHLAGWNATPVSGTFPITVFVVADVQGDHDGVSLGPLTDYVMVDPAAIKATGGIMGSPVDAANITTMAHEIGHACNLPHWYWSASNLMYPDSQNRAGNEVIWFQRNLLRSSRHVLYW
jgi:hypothetical protein